MKISSEGSIFDRLLRIIVWIVALMANLWLLSYGIKIIVTKEFHYRSGSLMPESHAVIIGFMLLGVVVICSYYFIKDIFEKKKERGK